MLHSRLLAFPYHHPYHRPCRHHLHHHQVRCDHRLYFLFLKAYYLQRSYAEIKHVLDLRLNLAHIPHFLEA